MKTYTMTGRVVRVGPTQSFASGFIKRELVVMVEGDDKYPQPLAFTFIKDKCAMVEGVRENDVVTVEFEIRGNASKDGLKYYVSLQACALRCERGARPVPVPPTPSEAPTPLQHTPAPADWGAAPQQQPPDDLENLPF